MNSNSVPIANLITWSLWAVIALLTAASWMSYAAGGWGVARQLGLTAAVLVGPATVCHIGLYAARMCTLIRLSAAVSQPTPPDLYTVHH